MDLRQLSALVAIADHGSFSAAARALYTVQSNVSGHVSRLERELGVTLVDRQRGGLTDEGAAVVERARRIQRELAAISADMTSNDDDIAGESRLGIIGTTARWLVPQFLTTLALTHPRVRSVVVEGSTSTLIPRLIEGQVDAIIVHLPLDDPELAVETLFGEDLVLVAHRSHPLAERDEASLVDLARHPLLLAPRGTALRRVIDRAATNAGVSLTPSAEVDGVRLLASLAFDGLGATIVPVTAVPLALRGDFTRIRVPELPRRVVGWAHRRRPAPSAAVNATLEVVRDLVAQRGALQHGLYVEDLTPFGHR